MSHTLKSLLHCFVKY